MKKALAVAGLLLVAVLVAYGLYALRPAPAALPDGEYLGFIRAVGNGSLTFDDAAWLTGKAAEDAAIAAGHCTETTRSECLPNDYFIKNEVAKDENLPLDGRARITMETWGMEETGQVAPRDISHGEFAALINDRAKHWNKLPYLITLEGGQVVKIEEVYIP